MQAWEMSVFSDVLNDSALSKLEVPKARWEWQGDGSSVTLVPQLVVIEALLPQKQGNASIQVSFANPKGFSFSASGINYLKSSEI